MTSVYTARLRSDDSGATFVKLPTPDRMWAFTVDLNVFDGLIFAATAYGICNLAADGENWQWFSEIRDAVLAADPYGSGRVFAGNAEGRIWCRNYSGDA